MRVRLLGPHRFWLAGQEIGVDDETGRALIAQGIAERLDAPETDRAPRPRSSRFR